MIIGAWVDFIVGKRYNGEVSDAAGQVHLSTPFLVLRKATGEEYLQYLIDGGATITATDRMAAKDEASRFYEISVD